MKLPKPKLDVSLIHRLIGVTSFVLLYWFWLSFGKDKIYWEGMRCLFSYSVEYFQEINSNLKSFIPVGFSYINLFFLQFLIVPWLGALVMVGLSVLNYIIIKRLLVKCRLSLIAAQYVALALIFAITVLLFFFHLFHGRFMFLTVLPIFYGTILGYLSIKNSTIRIIFGLVMLWILSLFVGLWSVAFVVLMLICEWLSLDKITTWFLVFLGILVSFFLPPYIWQHTFLDMYYIDMIMAKPIAINTLNAILLNVLIVGLPWRVVFATQWFPNFGRYIKNWMTYVVFVITIGWGATVLATNKDIQLLNLFYRIETNTEQRDWEAVLKYCDEYLHVTEESGNMGFSYYWVVDNTKFALVQTGRLLEDFFSYTRYEGFGLLFSQNLEISDLSHTGMYNFFLSMGLPSEAVRSAQNRVTFNTGLPFAQKCLAEAYLLAGDYRPAATMNNRLYKTLFFKKDALRFREFLTDTAKLNTDPFFAQHRKLLPQEHFATIQGNIDINIMRLWLSNPQNQRAGEYVVAMALSAKQHAVVFEEIEILFANFNYRHIPRHIEEALIAYFVFNTPEGLGMDPRYYLATQEFFGGLRIRRETIARADNFFHWLEKYQAGQVTFSEFEDAFGDTYWFHLLFIQVPPPEAPGQTSGYAI
jgi:hypothetical protein